MPRPQDVAPTYDQVIEEILRDVSGPMPAQELAEKILLARPSNAKNPMQAALKKMKESIGRELVFLDADSVLPLRLAWQGTRFRIRLVREELDRGRVDVGNSLPHYLPRQFDLAKLRFVDVDGQAIEFELKTVTEKENSIFGTFDKTTHYAVLSRWLHQNKFYQKDSLLFTIMDWENGVFKLERERYGLRDEKTLASRNRLLADIFYGMLENAARERLNLHDSLPTAYAQLPDKDGYPPDHWMVVVTNDERLSTNGWDIVYSDGEPSMLEELMREVSGKKPQSSKKTISKEQGVQVYRFKAELKGRTKIWRAVEIQGKQTLSDLNMALVHAFGHDFDHLGGFWKLVPRQGTKRGVPRFREVDLGSVDPFGEGEAADVTIAELEFSVGDKMKYVFDFGDWIEHTLTLEAIESSAPKVDYPREVGRNQPKHVYCVECKQEGRQSVAQYICVTCSSGPENERLLCEKCLEKHEDHYVEEILY